MEKEKYVPNNCNHCGEQLDRHYYCSLFNGKVCNSCIKIYKKKRYDDKKAKILESKSPEEYIRNKFRIYKHTATQRNKEFNLSEDYLIKLRHHQNGKCAYFGNEITFFSGEGSKKTSKLHASLDRIDSTKGYVPGNVAYTSNRYNSNIKKDIPLSFIQQQMPILRENIQKLLKSVDF